MQNGFIKVAAAIPSVKVADCSYNVQQIESLIAMAEGKGVKRRLAGLFAGGILKVCPETGAGKRAGFFCTRTSAQHTMKRGGVLFEKSLWRYRRRQAAGGIGSAAAGGRTLRVYLRLGAGGVGNGAGPRCGNRQYW